MKKYAVIVAGGNGSRMNSTIPKQFLMVNGKPMLFYSIDAFLNAYDDLEVILVLPEENTGAGQEIIDAFFDYRRIQITIGGRTRFHSVQNGLKLISEEGIVFVHDAVRCLISQELIHRCYDAATEKGSAIPVVECTNSVRLTNDDGNEMLDRERVKLVQTPQTFHSKILIPAYNIDYKEKYTDEASVVEAFGLKLNLVTGDDNNIKVTRPLDLVIAEHLLQMN
jgi:2-C-methyl-D-erythritol 4-phosphate cytidylyltransferase